MSQFILVTPAGDVDPLGNQMQRAVLVQSIASIDPNYTTTTGGPGGRVASETLTGSKITLQNGTTMSVSETVSAIVAASS